MLAPGHALPASRPATLSARGGSTRRPPANLGSRRKLTPGISWEQARREATSLRRRVSIVRETRQGYLCLKPTRFDPFLEIWRLSRGTVIGSESLV